MRRLWSIWLLNDISADPSFDSPSFASSPALPPSGALLAASLMASAACDLMFSPECVQALEPVAEPIAYGGVARGRNTIISIQARLPQYLLATQRTLSAAPWRYWPWPAAMSAAALAWLARVASLLSLLDMLCDKVVRRRKG